MLRQAAPSAVGDPGSELRPGLKDPLQSEQTPYEILGLTRGAAGADIQKAFALGVGKGKNVQKLTLAKKVLQSSADRAVIDLFHYMPEWADRLTPNPILQPDILDVPRRGATVQAWEKQLKTGFPDPLAAHSLAVLWYWWVIRAEEQRSQGKKLASIIPVDEMWQKAIGCWAMFLANHDFWSGTAGISRDIATQVGTAVIDRLNGRLQEWGQKHKGNGSAELAGRYHELELTLAHELRTARQIGSAGIRTPRGKVACGLLMLQQVDLLETVRQQVESGLQRSPSSESLKKLRQALSPYSSISALIENNEPQAALDTIEAKEKEEITQLAHSFWQQRGGKGGAADDDWSRAAREFRDKPEGKDLNAIRARALHCLAMQQTSLNKLDDALTSWELALHCRPEAELKSNILAAIVSSCQTAAAALQQRQPAHAIALLERALKLVDDPKLSLLLAELLTNRGIGLMNDAQKKSVPARTENIKQVKADLKKGLDDLERATKLGSRRAADQLKPARSLYDEFSIGSVLREAHEAAEREDWDTAVKCLRTALSSVSGDAAETVKKNLAVSLGNRAMATANRALERPNPAILRRDEMFAQISLASSFGTSCALCHTSYGASWYSLNLPEGGTARVCGDCTSKLQTLIADASKPDPTTLSVLQSAEKDLTEAVQLDPSSQQARKNLQGLQNIMSQIQGGAVARPRSASHSPVPTARRRNFKFWSSFSKNLSAAIQHPIIYLGVVAWGIAAAGNSNTPTPIVGLEFIGGAGLVMVFLYLVWKGIVSDFRNS